MKEKITVAHVIYSAAIGGSEMAALEICANLTAPRYEPVVLILFNGKGPMPDLLRQKGIRFYRLSFGRLARIVWPLWPALILRRLNIDILHVHHIGFLKIILSAARLAGIRRIILTEHSMNEIKKSPRLQGIAADVCRYADRITVVSGELKEYYSRLLKDTSNRIRVIYNGINPEKFSPAKNRVPLQSILPRNHLTPVIGTVGRLHEAKDYPNALWAMRVLKQKNIRFHYVIIGDGALKQELKILADNLEISDRVSFAGGRTDIHLLLQGMDIFVLPSRTEGFPIVLLEAMASGLPVVATQLGGIAEIVQDQVTGLLVPPQNPEALAAAMERLFPDKPLATHLARQARIRVEEHFSLSKTVKQYENVYSEVMEQPERSGTCARPRVCNDEK